MRSSRIRLGLYLGLRTILVVPFVVQLVAAVAVVWVIARLNSQRAVEHAVNHLRADIVARMREFISSWLSEPHRINEVNAAVFEGGLLDPGDVQEVLRLFWRELQVFPRVSYIQLGTEERSFVGVERLAGDRFRAWISNADTGYQNCHYEVDGFGNVGARTLPLALCRRYDPRVRPWYRAAMSADGPIWSGIYQFSNVHVDQELADMAVRVVHAPDGTVLGVLGVDLKLSQLGDFLRDLKVGETGVTFIMDREGGLVAGSTVGLPGTVDSDNRITRIRADACEDAFIARTAAVVQSSVPSLLAIQAPVQLVGQVGESKTFVHVLPFADGRGVDWLLVVVVPERDFMEEIRAGDRLTFLLVAGAFLVATLLGLITARRIVEPIRKMNASARALARGQWAEEVDVSSCREVVELAESFNLMARELEGFVHQLEEKVASRTRELDEKNRLLEKEVQERSRAQEELRRLAASDPLTGLLNRRRFHELAAAEEARAARYGHPLSVVLIDLDHFKLVNDTHGHQAGDEVLKEFARRCRRIARRTDVLARYGGEEFLVLLPETSCREAASVAERIRSTVAQEPFSVCEKLLNVTCSLGVAGTDTVDRGLVDQLIVRADKALYEAKAAGRNQVKVWQG